MVTERVSTNEFNGHMSLDGRGCLLQNQFPWGHRTTRDMGLNLWGSVPCSMHSDVSSSPQELEVVPGNRVKSPLGIPPGYWDGILNSISLIGVI